MPATFFLHESDYKLLERAVMSRMNRKQSRLNVAWFAQMFAWMFMTLAVMTFFRQHERHPADAWWTGYILLFAVVGFLFASLRPLAGLWVYRKYVRAWDPSFTDEQVVDIKDGSIVLESACGTAIVPRRAIIDVSDDDANHYLFLTGVQAIVLPKQAAATLGDAFSEFLQGTNSG